MRAALLAWCALLACSGGKPSESPEFPPTNPVVVSLRVPPSITSASPAAVVLFASWSARSRLALPLVERLCRERAVRLVLLSLDTSLSRARDSLSAWGVGAAVSLVTLETLDSLGGVWVLPTVFLVDAGLVARYRYDGWLGVPLLAGGMRTLSGGEKMRSNISP